MSSIVKRIREEYCRTHGIPLTEMDNPPKRQKVSPDSVPEISNAEENPELHFKLPPHPEEEEPKNVPEYTEAEAKVRMEVVCCYCPGAVPAKCLVSRKANANYGKQFYKCGTSKGPECKPPGESYFFAWKTDIGPACPKEGCGCTWSMKNRKKKKNECGLCGLSFI